MSDQPYDADWVLPPPPDHPYADGCCDRPHAEHELTEAERSAYTAWMETEPGLRQRLAHRKAQLARLIALGADGVILENQRRMIKEVADQLGETDA